MNERLQELLTARAMLREGFSLADAAEEIGWSVADLDRALWRFVGDWSRFPTGVRTQAFLAGRAS